MGHPPRASGQGGSGVVKADQNGQFTIPSLRPGKYARLGLASPDDLSEEDPDFEEARETGETIEVEANEAKQATIHSKIGEKAEQDGPE